MQGGPESRLVLIADARRRQGDICPSKTLDFSCVDVLALLGVRSGAYGDSNRVRDSGKIGSEAIAREGHQMAD